ncbi:myocyte-specific enhancer factor 2B [Electrophorus electricus]|uniref:MADS-box domain-containing protein n=1 Tax=Electrophorus electricus TaxID=8005 RepID=A0A4W4HG96_ELEEL|nr:myocyte-specific enhancer factor 2B [Electrophorus electricus]XP_026863946.2 myocyte-specific enhancer factor 2B [Electrophorus electricus]XP_026863947.2 myocyte-specific enhancer factor 2B [Electrophorus electricus]
MGRKKIQISRILDQRNRQVTFTKRKFGLMKKAYELSVLCDCEIALIIFNSTNRLFQYASTDMDKVLLKYTEYSEPHESRTNSDILETLRRKGLGLEASEVDHEDSMQIDPEKYLPSEGMDLSVSRQRYYNPSLHPAEAPVLAGSENGYVSVSNPGLGVNRPPPFKTLSSRPGNAVPTGPNSHATLMGSHAGIGYSMFSHGNLSRTLEMKTPPPLSLASEGRRVEPHPGQGGTRGNLTNARALYQSVHSGGHMMAMGKPGLLAHTLGNYGSSEYCHPGYTMGFQRSWQPLTHQEQQQTVITPGISSGGGCSYQCQGSSASTPPHSSLTLSIKSERTSPDHIRSPATPPTRHTAHSPMGGPEFTNRPPPEPYDVMDREDVLRGGYTAPHSTARSSGEEKGDLPLKQLEISDGWPR